MEFDESSDIDSTVFEEHTEIILSAAQQGHTDEINVDELETDESASSEDEEAATSDENSESKDGDEESSETNENEAETSEEESSSESTE